MDNAQKLHTKLNNRIKLVEIVRNCENTFAESFLLTDIYFFFQKGIDKNIRASKKQKDLFSLNPRLKKNQKLKKHKNRKTNIDEYLKVFSYHQML